MGVVDLGSPNNMRTVKYISQLENLYSTSSSLLPLGRDFSSNFSFLQKISSQEFWNSNSELKGNDRKILDFDDGLTGDEQLYQHSRKARTFLIT